MYSTTSTSSVEPSNIAGIQTNDARIDVNDSEKEAPTDINQNVNVETSNVDTISGLNQTNESNKTDGVPEKPKGFIDRFFWWKK